MFSNKKYKSVLFVFQDGDKLMIEVLDQLSPVVLESFLHMAVSETGNVSDMVNVLNVVCEFRVEVF